MRGRHRPHPVPALLSAVMAAVLALPVVALLVSALSPQLWPLLLAPAVADALKVSAVTTSAALSLTLLLGTPTAFLLARTTFPGKAWLESFLDLPLVLPPVVAGVALLLVFGRTGWLGAPLELAGINLAFSPGGVVLAQFFTSAPFYIRSARAGFSVTDTDVEAAAQVDGAGRAQTFWRITFPLSLPFLLEGAILAWARSLGEFGATLLFAGSLQGQTQTVPLAIYAALESDLAPALVLSGLMVLLAFGILLLLRWIAGYRGP